METGNEDVFHMHGRILFSRKEQRIVKFWREMDRPGKGCTELGNQTQKEGHYMPRFMCKFLAMEKGDKQSQS